MFRITNMAYASCFMHCGGTKIYLKTTCLTYQCPSHRHLRLSDNG